MGRADGSRKDTTVYTYDTSDHDARYLIRGYFTGDGQHWWAIWDRERNEYLRDYFGYIVLYRSGAECVAFLRHHGYV